MRGSTKYKIPASEKMRVGSFSMRGDGKGGGRRGVHVEGGVCSSWIRKKPTNRTFQAYPVF